MAFELRPIKNSAPSSLQDLVSSVRDIKAELRAIDTELDAFDTKAGYASDVGLGPSWEIFNKRFDTLLSYSYQSVSETRNVINELKDILRPGVEDDSISFERICRQAESPIYHLQKKLDASDVTITDGFRYLARTFLKLAVTMEHSVNTRSNILSRDLQNAQKRLDNLCTHFSHVENKKTHGIIACALFLWASIASAAYFAFVCSPEAKHELAFSTIVLICLTIHIAQWSEEAKKLELELTEVQQNIGKLDEQHLRLRKSQDALSSTRDNIENFFKRVDVFWSMIRSDMLCLHAQIEYAVGPDMGYTRFFRKKVQLSDQLFDDLSEAFERYMALAETQYTQTSDVSGI